VGAPTIYDQASRIGEAADRFLEDVDAVAE